MVRIKVLRPEGFERRSAIVFLVLKAVNVCLTFPLLTIELGGFINWAETSSYTSTFLILHHVAEVPTAAAAAAR